MNAVATFVRTIGPARIAAVGTLATVILGMAIFAFVRVSAPEMRPLFTDLDFDDSAAIVRDLESQSIPFELRNEGSTILVPNDIVLRLRMRLAENGLPAGGNVGYEIFDRGDGLGATSFVQNLNHLRALEGELARTIRTIDRVKSARVHLVLPERRLFSSEETEPSASIVLNLRGPLANGQTKAIQHLVAAAVKGMQPDRVSVVDDRGELLASGLGDDELVFNSSLEERRISLEQRLKAQVEAIVTSVVGTGNARVQVTAELDTTRVTETEDVFDPEGQVVRSTQIREEETSAVDRMPSGGVSASNELPSANAEGGDNGASQEAKAATEEVINYEISKRSRTEVREAGSVKRLSVAVLVDGLYDTAEGGDITYTPRSQEQIDQIAQLVRSAIGFDRERGDTVEVVNLRFAPPAAGAELGEDGEGADLTAGDYLRIAELVVLALVGLILVLFVVRPLLGRILASDEVIAGRLPPPGSDGPAGEEAMTFPAGTDGRALAAPAGAAPAEMPRFKVDEVIDMAKLTGEVQENSVRKIAELVTANPDEAAAIMRQWLNQAA